MKYNVAVVGATGNVGREMLKTLWERDFPVDNVYAVASENSVGKEVSYGEDGILKVEGLKSFDFSKVDIALFSAGGNTAKEFAPKAAAQNCIIIDNSSHFRMDKDVPLVVPEVNSYAIRNFKKKNIIANPNCSTIQMVVALKPLHDRAEIKRVVVSTYQSVSGAGKSAMDELFNQTRAIYVNDNIEKHQFTKQIAFNAIPHIDVFMDDGTTKEEWKMMAETKKILDPDIDVAATCVRIPVFIGHGESVNVEFKKPINDDDARDLYRDRDDIGLVDFRADEGYVTPAECAGEDKVYVSRIRKDKTVKNGLSLWIVSDNLRKGAALNAIQIAEDLAQNNLYR